MRLETEEMRWTDVAMETFMYACINVRSPTINENAGNEVQQIIVIKDK